MIVVRPSEPISPKRIDPAFRHPHSARSETARGRTSFPRRSSGAPRVPVLRARSAGFERGSPRRSPIWRAYSTRCRGSNAPLPPPRVDRLFRFVGGAFEVQAVAVRTHERRDPETTCCDRRCRRAARARPCARRAAARSVLIASSLWLGAAHGVPITIQVDFEADACACGGNFDGTRVTRPCHRGT